MSSALPFHFDDDDNASSSDDDSSCTSSSSASSSSSNHRGTLTTPSSISAPRSTPSSSSTPVGTPSSRNIPSSSSSFLSPPPSIPLSNDTPLRTRSGSYSGSHVIPSSPVPSLSSTPTGTDYNYNHNNNNNAGSYNSRTSTGYNNNSGSGSGSNTPVSVSPSMMSYMDMANRPRSNPRNNRSMANVVGSFHRMNILNNNDDEEDHNSDSNANGNGNGNDNDNGSDTNQQNQQQQQQGAYYQRRRRTSTSTAATTTSTDSNTSATTSTTTTNNANSNNNITIGGRILGLGANSAVGTILQRSNNGSSRLNALYETKYQNNTKSDKQRPGQRKQRRWNNDKFVGIASEICINHSNPKRASQIANLYAEAEMERHKYTMPNFPRNYRTIFGTLATCTDPVGVGGEGSISGSISGRGGSRGLHQGHGDLEIDDSLAEGIGAEKIYGLNRAQLRKVRQRFVDGEV